MEEIGSEWLIMPSMLYKKISLIVVAMNYSVIMNIEISYFTNLISSYEYNGFYTFAHLKRRINDEKNKKNVKIWL